MARRIEELVSSLLIYEKEAWKKYLQKSPSIVLKFAKELNLKSIVRGHVFFPKKFDEEAKKITAEWGLDGALLRKALKYKGYIDALEVIKTKHTEIFKEIFNLIAYFKAQWMILDGWPYEEFISECQWQIMRALDKFSPKKGNFLPYLYSIFDTSRLRAIHTYQSSVKVSLHTYHKFGKQVTENHKGAENELTLEALRVMKPAVPLDFREEDSDRPLYETLEDPTVRGVEESVLEALDMRLVRAQVEESQRITERQREILKLYYGLNSKGDAMSLKEIGKIYGVTHERIRQLREQALQVLREELEIGE